MLSRKWREELGSLRERELRRISNSTIPDFSSIPWCSCSLSQIPSTWARSGCDGCGTQLLVPQANFPFLVILYATIILLLVIFVSYKRYARILKWICLSLVTYVLTGLLIPLNWGQVLLAAIVPHIEWNFAFLFLVVGILGTTISPYMIFWEPDEEVEEEIEAGMLPVGTGKPKLRKGYIGKMKLDTFVGMLCSEIITFFIIVTTAATPACPRHYQHSNAYTSSVGIATAGSFLSTCWTSYKNPLFDRDYRDRLSCGPDLCGEQFVCDRRNLWLPEGLSQTFPQAKVFYLIIIASTAVGVLINFLGINPFSALIYTACSTVSSLFH